MIEFYKIWFEEIKHSRLRIFLMNKFQKRKKKTILNKFIPELRQTIIGFGRFATPDIKIVHTIRILYYIGW